MANIFASTSSVGTLKTWFTGAVVNQFNDEMPLYKHMDKGKEKWAGQQVVRSIKVRRNQGIGATSDGGVLPAIGAHVTVPATIANKYNYLRFGITAALIKASQGGDKAAFANELSYSMEQGLVDAKDDIGRQLFWDGSSDLATVSANAVASTVITATGRESTEDGNKFLDVGMVIDIVSGSTVVASGVSITAISGTTTATLTLSAAVTVSANDIIVRSGSLNQEIQGLLTTLDGATTTIYGVDRSAYPVFQGNSVNNNGNQLTLDVMKQTLNQALRRGGAKIDAVFCDFDTDRFYEKLLIADKRYVGKVKGDGTFASKEGNYLEYAGVPMVPDRYSPQRIFMLDSKTWKKYVMSEFEWADETGSELIAQPSSDVFEARLRLFANVFCEKPSANAVLKNYISP